MKKDNNHIDKLFNDSLNERSFDIPEAFLEDLNKRLDTSERKRRVFFWWFTGLLCITGFSLVIFFSLQSPSLPLSDSTPFTQPASNPVAESYPAVNSDTPFGQTTLSVTSDELAIFDPMTGKTHRMPGTSAIKTKKQRAEMQDQNELSARKHLQAKIGKNQTSNTLASNGNTGTQTSLGLNNPGKPTDASKSVSDNAATTTTKETITGAGTTKPDSTGVSGTEKDSTLAVNAADTTSSNPLDSPEDPADDKKSSPNEDWRKEIQLFGGLGANFINDSHADKAYLEKIKANQSSILASSFGIRGNLSYKKLTFGTGLSYSQTGEKYDSEMTKYTYKDSTYSEYIIDTILVFDDSLGIWVPVIHDTTIYHTYQYKQDSVLERLSFTNRYSWISIPIHFGYRFELGKYELIPRVGAQFNFGITKNRGRFPNGDANGIVEYQAVRFTVSYLVQLEVRRNFNRWHVFINPYFNSMINPAISGDLIRRKYSSWGIQFGIGLKL